MIIYEFMSFERVHVEAGLVASDGVEQHGTSMHRYLPANMSLQHSECDFVTLMDRITEARYVVFTASGHNARNAVSYFVTAMRFIYLNTHVGGVQLNAHVRRFWGVVPV